MASDGTTVASRLSYDPWGKVTETGSVLSDFTYTGHYFDRATGLNLAWYRGYDPNLGRWLSKDPIDLEGGLNLYVYVDNDPINTVDPSGRNLQSFMECMVSGIPRRHCFSDEHDNWCTAFPWLCGLPPPPPDPDPQMCPKLREPEDEDEKEHRKRRPSTKEKHEKGK